MNGERREAVLRQLELFRADAEGNERARQLGSMSYAYPQSLGEWLGTAVQIAATVSWQVHLALRPLAQQADHERRIAEQGRAFIELYGALLVGALAACDAALEREVAPELEVDVPEIDPVLEVWDEARDERNGLVFSITALGEAIWIYGTCRTETPRCCRPLRPSCSRRPALQRSLSPSPTSPELSDHAGDQRRDGVIATRPRA